MSHSKKKYKVVVIGLPKTGTSTLAVMLRMLNYTVTGPDIKYKFGDARYLDETFGQYDGFQDYPWCFEWQRFLKYENTKFIVLNREKESWLKSFYESYGRDKESYLSFPYMKILKERENKEEFLNYFDSYYKTANEYVEKLPSRFLNISLKAFEWEELCDFLEEELPTNIFGRVVKKPHINKKNYKKDKKKFTYKTKRKLQSFIGKHYWNKTITFLRKNGIVK
ncbi:sulfotransferase [Winogradskyella ouciana]|uniref:sulfotransferase n=1 Tax=Winogradskyella ouciana TaxID=2608631 RepID=UPI003D2D04A9